MNIEDMAKFKLHEALKDMLEQHDKSITQLARECKIPVSVLHGWVNGTLPSARNLHHIVKLSNHLEVTIEELLFGLKKSSKEPNDIFSCQFDDGEEKYKLIIRKVSSK